ncbi:response regulator transcription factor [Streptococcus sobrinus]|uniref:response regulator transcription factor n=1 Tax=Streptococcus sobrinus TaxID=1310 RepID=UPI0002F357C9|nr:response regulator transcription factor [Streptococcus sobrinus]
MNRILVVDDDKDILELVKTTLELNHYLVDIAENPAGLNKDNLTQYDLIILDIMMPEIDGLTFCQEIRPLVDCPIVFLTAKSQETDIVLGLGYGADDYISKPFGIEELLARVSAHLRRERRDHHSKLVSGDIQFDLSSKEVKVKQAILDLTKSEYEICDCLLKHRGQVFSKEQLYEELYGYDERGMPSAIAEHIKNIRAKFRDYGQEPIKTVWGIGYKWE